MPKTGKARKRIRKPKTGNERKDGSRMALTKAKVREILSTAGVDAEHMTDAVNAIIDGHVTSIEALREENGNLKADLKAANEKADMLPGVQKELDDLKKQNEEDAKAREGKDYDALQKQFDEYKAEIIARDTKAAKEKAFRDILKDLNVSEKGVTLALKYQNFDSIELEDNGKIKGASDLRKSLKEDWGDYIVKSETKGADTATPPGGNGGSKGYKTKEEIMDIKDRSERQKAIADNPGLFGIDEGE